LAYAGKNRIRDAGRKAMTPAMEQDAWAGRASKERIAALPPG